MFTNFSVIPLRVSVIIGFLFSAIGIILGLLTVIEKIVNPDLPQGYTFLVVFISMFSGVQLIAIGMVGEYVGRILLSINKRPQYIIKDKCLPTWSANEGMLDFSRNLLWDNVYHKKAFNVVFDKWINHCYSNLISQGKSLLITLGIEQSNEIWTNHSNGGDGLHRLPLSRTLRPAGLWCSFFWPIQL